MPIEIRVGREEGLREMLKRMVGVAVAVVALLALTGCAETDFTGRGNDFEINATITKVTDESVLIKDIEVLIADGEAHDWFTSEEGWFDPDHQELHDNLTGDTGGFWGYKKRRVGQVYDSNGNLIRLKDLRRGQRIHAVGKVRYSNFGKYDSLRAVFDDVTVVG